MMMFVEFPVTQLRLVIRVSILCVLAVDLSGPYMLLTYTEKFNVCSYTINSHDLKLQ